MRSKVLLPCVVASMAAALFAQNVTVPAVMNGVEGGGGTNVPFGSNLSCRYQCIYDAGELPWTGPRVLTAIDLRADFGTGAAIPAKGYLEVSVLMSTTAKDSVTASPTFEDNYGADATWVVQNQVMQLPAQPMLPDPPGGPRPANIPFVFSAPWAYGFTPVVQGQPAPDSLLVEIWIHFQPAGSYRIDNTSNCSAATAAFGNAGPACAQPGSPPVELTGAGTMLAGSSYSWHVEYAAPSVPFLVLLNLTNQGGLFGNPAWPLPYPMFDPANPNQQSPALLPLVWPAPDCWLNVSPAVSLGGVTDPAGLGTATGIVPPGTQFVGTTFYAQAIVLAPTVNPLRFITSRGLATTICGPLGITRIYAFYNPMASPPQPLPQTGSMQHGVGLIFDVQ